MNNTLSTLVGEIYRLQNNLLVAEDLEFPEQTMLNVRIPRYILDFQNINETIEQKLADEKYYKELRKAVGNEN